jgi:hypothetical protein
MRESTCGSATWRWTSGVCPTWLDLFLRAARMDSFGGWEYVAEVCSRCENGEIVRLYLHPLGRAYCADVCLRCHTLRVTFCDEDINGSDWEWLEAYPPPGLYSTECAGDSGWPATNGAVAALRRAIEEGERAEEAGWRAQPNLRLAGKSE